MKYTELNKTTVETDTTNELRSVSRTRRVIDSMLWAIAFGAIVFSLATGAPLVSAHSPWHWMGFLLPLVVDAGLILSLSADSILSRHGIKSGKWPTAFRWLTALSSLFLNCWSGIALHDWVGMTVHSIAPVILVCAAEVAPIYRRRFHEIELSLTDQIREFTATNAVQKKRTTPVQITSGATARETEELTSSQRAIRDGFLSGKKASEVAKEIGVSQSYAYTQYKRMREEMEKVA